MRTERGAVLLVVLVVLTMMTILGAAMSRSATARMLAARDFLRVETEAREWRDAQAARRAGGDAGGGHATIGSGATDASLH